MAQIDIPNLKAQAISGARRADMVRHDPVVIEALDRLRSDAQQTLSHARRALNSGGDLVAATRKSWAESGDVPAMAALDRS